MVAMSRSVKARLLALACAVLAAGVLPKPVLAAQMMLEEVIVTAEKRTELLSQVPMAVTAVSGQVLKQFNGFSFNDLDKFTAGLDIAGGNFDDVIAMRGLSTRLNAPVESRVSVYWDDAYVAGQPRAVFVSQFDLQQVEILRGPQGTLYGQTSPAGAIVFHTRNPSLEKYEGNIEQSFSQRHGSNTQLGLSIPVVKDQFGIRIAGVFDRNSAQDIRNITLNRDVIDRNTGWRIVALWEPSDSFTGRLSYNSVHQRSEDDFVIEGNGLRYGDRKAIANTPGTVNQRQNIAVLNLDWNITDRLKLTSVSTYQQSHIHRLRDDDALAFDKQIVDTNSVSTTMWSQELRLASSNNDFWDWMAGAFVQHSQIPTHVDVNTRVLQPVLLGSSFYYAPLTNYVTTTAYPEVKGAAGFLHNEFHLPADTDLTVGIRYNYEDREATQPFHVTTFLELAPVDSQGAAGYVPQGSSDIVGIPPDAQKFKEHAWTGTVKLAHHFNDRFMVYGAYDRAWRNGSGNIAALPLPPNLSTNNPETSDNYEVGTKFGFWQGRGSFSLSVYYQTYHHFQYGVQSLQYMTQIDSALGPQTTVAVSDLVTNADEVVSKGFDSTLRLLLTENWTLTTSLSYNNTEFTKFDNAPCNGPTPLNLTTNQYNTCDLKGEHAGQQPEWSLVMMSQYTHPLPGTQMQWFVRGLVKAESKRWDPDVAEYHHGYATMDFYLGFSSANWEVSVWAKNAFDRQARFDVQPLYENDYSLANTVANAGTGLKNSGYRAVRQLLEPRTLGITGSYHF